MTEPAPVQMMHSFHTTYDRAEVPPEGKAPDDLNTHINGHIRAGWVLAFYSTIPAPVGTVHHFIWKTPG